MSTSKQFNGVMREWVELFMTRSMQDLARFIKRADLSMAQYSTLMRLHHLDNCGVSDIGEKLGITNAAASQLVDKLVQAGLVARTEALHDRRVRQLALTDQGRAVVKSSLEARVGWTRGLGESLPPSKRAAIIQALSELIEAAQGLEQPAA
jgi:DNA-binding MarR family transcriptional regulator